MYLSDKIIEFYELPFGTDVIKPGDELKIRNVRGIFIFIKMAHNMQLDKQWIDCRNKATGEFKSFYVYDIKKVIRPKRSRAKSAK